MRRRLGLFIVIFALTVVTHSQPTIILTDDDFDNGSPTLANELSVLTANIEAMDEKLLRVADGVAQCQRSSALASQLSALRADVEHLNEQTSTRIDPGPAFVYSSCKEIRDANSSSASGEYTVRTVSGRILEKVYCEMGLNGGGYTFINPKDLAGLTDNEVQAMFTDKNSFLMRVRRADTTQPYGVLQQLSQYQTVPLKLGLNEYSGYAGPQNIGNLGSNFLYFGFIPVSMARSRSPQGLRVNGHPMVFTNCDANPNSYIVLFPNFAERAPTTYARQTRFPFCINMFNSMQANPSGRVMPQEYFMFLETHWGGCGCYAQTDGRVSVSGTLAAAIGFR